MNKYKNIKKIGQGTYGVVYKAKNLETKQIVAVKQMKLEHEDEGIPCTAIREISLLKELHHINIVQLFDVIHTEKNLTLVFEYMDLGDLKQLMDMHAQSGGMNHKQARSFLFQMLRGIAFCHHHSILHRDLKPQNLLVNKEGELKLADFGLARAFGIPVKKFTNEVVTLWYRPPEILLGSTTYTTSVDMWSIGAIFAEMLHPKLTPLFGGAKNDIEQFSKICDILGTPTNDTWPGIESLPKYQDVVINSPYMKMKASNSSYSLNSGSNFPSQQAKSLENVLPNVKDPCAMDLLTKLLQLDPSKRISAQDALNHPYFSCFSNK